MFDSIAPPPASRRRKMFFAASGVVHGAAVVALIAGAMWRVDKLEYERQHAALAVIPPPPAGSSGSHHSTKMPDPTVKKVPPKIKIHTPVQPVHVTTEQPTTTETSTSTTPGDSETEGPDTGIPTIGAGCIEGTSCGVTDSTTPPPAPKPCSDPSRIHDADCAPKQPPKIVIVENLRISGETQIQPEDDVKIRMERDGQSRLHVSFKVCLDESGAVTSTSRMGSTGYASYDDALAAAISTWRYRPYSVNGTAIPVCGPVTFTFTLTR
jgi:TonB family protein